MTATNLLGTAYIVGVFDVAELAFILFFIFFVGLVIYLNRESRREGYPLEHEQTGVVERGTPLFDAGKKTFKLPHGRGTYTPEDVARDPVDIPAKQAFGAAGAPFVPTGDAMADGLGPAAYANRNDYPDLTMEGAPRIVPIAASHGITIAEMDMDPVGLPVYAADKKKAGVVSDVWVDQAEHIIRYLEVTTNSGKKVLAPMGFCAVQGKGFLGGITPLVDDQTALIDITAIRADQFDAVPAIATAGQITRLEEDKIQGYFGGGYMYATAERSEPWL
ncbi:H subunit of photosynthetic reaction center complex [Erythrobacter sp. NAP1]|uniref:photosynthetic reaction center subunit H n=1 Tax=Erythrobacter sp. NAP1 TaxID=237727 RepID=UPI0000685256|nr:photosynthetic reaction center subunit H [Erythrobacter sp. NAP1]EAQ27802.1 H subunit of photosynthetic reaction center complex [Erythrobacter sp. NAP1]